MAWRFLYNLSLWWFYCYHWWSGWFLSGLSDGRMEKLIVTLLDNNLNQAQLCSFSWVPGISYFHFTNWLTNLHFIWIFKPCFHLQRRSLFLLVQDARSICIFYQCQRPQAFIADCRIVPAHHQAVCPRAKFSVTIAPFLLDTVPVRSNYPVSFPLPTQEGRNI